ncbi:MAG: hypothetical protein WCG97_01240 [bacterium]
MPHFTDGDIESLLVVYHPAYWEVKRNVKKVRVDDKVAYVLPHFNAVHDLVTNTCRVWADMKKKSKEWWFSPPTVLRGKGFPKGHSLPAPPHTPKKKNKRQVSGKALAD